MLTPVVIKTKDATELAAKIYTPLKANGSVIVISPSFDVTQDTYRPIAHYFQENNFTVITYDFRGMGESKPKRLRGYKADLRQWAFQDTDSVLRYAKQNFEKQELIFMGHGISGEIIGLVPASQFINRLVLVNTSLSCTRLRRWQDKFQIYCVKFFIKSVTWFFGYFPGKSFGLLHNLPKGVVMQWMNWCSYSNGLFDDFSDHNYRKLQVPLLAFSFTDDWRSQKTGVKAILSHFTTAQKTWYHFKPTQVGKKRIGNKGFFKKYSSEILWSMLLNWINEK